MRWRFWRRRKAARDREHAREDGTSLGNILLRAGMITAEQLHQALEFQDDNPDVMLGEALINLGVVERGVVEALLVAQDARRGGAHSADIVSFATEHTKKRVHKAHDDLREAVIALNGKVAKS